MAETTVQINLDDKSIEILKGVNKIHRDSVISIGLALVEKTGFYRTLTGKNKSNELEDVASIGSEDEEKQEVKVPNTTKTTKTIQPEKKSTTWDSF